MTTAAARATSRATPHHGCIPSRPTSAGQPGPSPGGGLRAAATLAAAVAS
eukprot:CAMPEP_0185396924 /NCGR_PEP_ID=MMETSP1364-20130426/85713_1 /TAXON_ID=38817 /ORGANISM="Gephyrocapsa oceanica, Strain RCC1303" /LENGTH=49 /DNA_ID= /DNA_START= /DNA_END= /DNA_ORIENTATION=